jgi:hypothetical protein
LGSFSKNGSETDFFKTARAALDSAALAVSV